MNFRNDFTRKQQGLLEELDIKIEDKEYSTEEMKDVFNTITNHVMSKSSKNGELTNELNRYNDIMAKLIEK